MIRFFGYDKCSTCRKAKRALADAGVAFEDVDITVNPPTEAQLRAALKAGYSIAELFNRSGVQYRELNMKEKLKTLGEAQLIGLLATNGRLCKRPFVIEGSQVTVGFKPERFEPTWL